MLSIKFSKRRARVSAVLWALLGLEGTVVAIIATLNLALNISKFPFTLPAWFPLVGASNAINFLWCLGGCTIASCSLWGLYAQTVHARED
jgi:hypothetical protein